MLRNPSIPRPNKNALPEEEREDCNHVAWLLGVLESYRVDFESALRLYMYCNIQIDNVFPALAQKAKEANDREREADIELSTELRREWRSMAMRDAALSVYHFGYILDGIIKSVHRCPTLMTTINIPTLYKAQPLFKKCFPQWEQMRNAVAHAGETQHSRATMERARYEGTLDLGGIALTGIAGGRELSRSMLN